jgi:hypothetical protein
MVSFSLATVVGILVLSAVSVIVMYLFSFVLSYNLLYHILEQKSMKKLLILTVGRYFFIPPNRMGLELEKLTIRYTVYHTIGIALFGGVVISVRDKLTDKCGDMADSGTAIQTVYSQKSVLYACNGGARIQG